jgi:transposase
MRKSINGLARVVAETLGHDPVGAHWFVFCNRRHYRLKILLGHQRLSAALPPS